MEGDHNELEDIDKYLDDAFDHPAGEGGRGLTNEGENHGRGSQHTNPTLTKAESEWAKLRELELTLEHAILEKDAFQAEADALRGILKAQQLAAQSEALDKDLLIAELERAVSQNAVGATAEARVQELADAFERLQEWHLKSTMEVTMLKCQLDPLIEERAQLHNYAEKQAEALVEAEGIIQKLNETALLDSQLIAEYEEIEGVLKADLASTSNDLSAFRSAFDKISADLARERSTAINELGSVSSENEILKSQLVEAKQFLVPEWKALLLERQSTKTEPPRSLVLKARIGQALSGLSSRVFELMATASAQADLVDGVASVKDVMDLTDFCRISGSVFSKSVIIAAFIRDNFLGNLLLLGTSNPVTLSRDRTSIRWISNLAGTLADSCYWLVIFCWASVCSADRSLLELFRIPHKVAAGGQEVTLLTILIDHERLLDDVLSLCAADNLSGTLDLSLGKALPDALFSVIRTMEMADPSGTLSQALDSCNANPPILVAYLTFTRCVASVLCLACTVTNAPASEIPDEQLELCRRLLAGSQNISQVCDEGLPFHVDVVLGEKYPSSMTWAAVAGENGANNFDAFVETVRICRWAERLRISLSTPDAMDSATNESDLIQRKFATDPALDLASPGTAGDGELRNFMARYEEIAYVERLMGVVAGNAAQAAFQSSAFLESAVTHSFRVGQVSPGQRVGADGGDKASRASLGDRGALEAEVVVVRAEAVKQREEIAKLEFQAESFKAKLAALEVGRGDLEDAKAQRSKFVNSIEQQSREVTKLRQDVDSLSSERDDIIGQLAVKTRTLQDLQSRQSDQLRIPPRLATQENIYLRAVLQKLKDELAAQKIRQAQLDWEQLKLEKNLDQRNQLRERANAASRGVSEICNLRKELLGGALRLPPMSTKRGGPPTPIDYAKELVRWRDHQLVSDARLRWLKEKLTLEAEKLFCRPADPLGLADPDAIIPASCGAAASDGFFPLEISRRVNESAEWQPICVVHPSEKRDASEMPLYMSSYPQFESFRKRMGVQNV